MVPVKEPPTAPDSRPRHSTSVSGLSSRQCPDSAPTAPDAAPDTPTVRAQGDETYVADGGPGDTQRTMPNILQTPLLSTVSTEHIQPPTPHNSTPPLCTRSATFRPTTVSPKASRTAPARPPGGRNGSAAPPHAGAAGPRAATPSSSPPTSRLASSSSGRTAASGACVADLCGAQQNQRAARVSGPPPLGSGGCSTFD